MRQCRTTRNARRTSSQESERESENLSAELNHENAKKNDGSFLSSVMT